MRSGERHGAGEVADEAREQTTVDDADDDRPRGLEAHVAQSFRPDDAPAPAGNFGGTRVIPLLVRGGRDRQREARRGRRGVCARNGSSDSYDS
jgi:hypothetical protein